MSHNMSCYMYYFYMQTFKLICLDCHILITLLILSLETEIEKEMDRKIHQIDTFAPMYQLSNIDHQLCVTSKSK